MFGETLKSWRSTRRMSQLDLALEANVSARHISFLETGRARPSRDMVLHLADVMEVPRGSRNALLQDAGFAPAYFDHGTDGPEMAPVVTAIEWTMNRHDPYPAVAFDRAWRLRKLNKAATLLFGAAGVGEGDSILDMITDPGFPARVGNWAEVGAHALLRLKAENRQAGGVAELERAIEVLSKDPEIATWQPPDRMPAFVPTTYLLGDMSLSLMTTIAAFSTAEDVTLADLRLELFYPADEASAALLTALAEGH